MLKLRHAFPLLPSQPYINTFFLREWPWISHAKSTFLPQFIICVYINFVQRIVGDLGFIQSLFKSFPASPQRWLPRITPSGLSIGTILKIRFCRRVTATSSALSKNWISPRIIYEEFDSPGWTRADRYTYFRHDIGTVRVSSKLVIVRRSQSMPPKDLHKTALLQ